MHTQNVNNKTATTPPPERWVAKPLRFVPCRYQAGILLREDVLFATKPELAKLVAIQWVEDDDVRTVGGEQ